ncbi:MAG TPA: hypothetical protein EYH56_01955 [Nanoarchaeota archaeon]|nr:hypothetical protein [Nanoarchaeota archaeon]
MNSYNSSYNINPSTRIEIYDKLNNLVVTAYGNITTYLEIYENYTYKSFTPVSSGLEVRIYNLNITKQNLIIEEQVVESYSGYLPNNITKITPVYALNDSELVFEKAKLIIPKAGVNVQNVLHCIAWDFANANCSQWEFLDKNNLEGYGENETHIWFNVTDFEAYAGASSQPDLVARNIIFNVSQSGIVENEALMISANISEEAGVDAINVSVLLEIYNYNGTLWILKESKEKIVNISATTYKLVNFTWRAKPGTWRFSITVDPSNEIEETDETNNFNSTTYNVSGWTIYYGFTNGWIAIKDSVGNNFIVWIPLTQQGNLYFSDYDSEYQFAHLMPLNGTNDLEELDKALNMTGFSDSVKALFDKNNDGVADAKACFEIASRVVCDVPIINSTDSNNGNFVTGILWDSADGGDEYNGTQDVVFITKINPNAQGSYGTYDYEIRVPALLRNLKGTNDLIKIFMEVK